MHMYMYVYTCVSGHAGLRPLGEAAALLLAVRLGAVREGLPTSVSAIMLKS